MVSYIVFITCNIFVWEIPRLGMIFMGKSAPVFYIARGSSKW